MAEPPALDAQLATLRSLYGLQQIVVDGHAWSYVDTGAARQNSIPQNAMPLLLLPGALGAADTSFQYILAFAAERRVVSLDYPPTLPALTPLIQGLEGVLGALDLGQVAVVGGSYSGLVAQYFAAGAPRRVGALLLSNIGAPAPAEALRWRLAAGAVALLPQEFLHTCMRLGIGRFLHGDSPAHTFWRAYFAQAIPALQKHALLARLRLTAAMHARAGDLGGRAYRGPTLIVAVEGDGLVSPAQGAALRGRYPQALCVTLCAQGHVASLDAAESYIAIYQEFLCQNRLGGPQ
jgi:pimeloyl-ACP methyl ester carboxylesterase